jgi:DNA-3-methyladenine glycosylase II
LNQRLPNLNPEQFLTLSDAELLQIGFSRQKARYTRNLAEAIRDGILDLEVLLALPDDQVFSRLTGLTGIGPWTANIYLLMALGRPDIWPGGDLALIVALKNLLKLEHRPSAEEFQTFGEKWRPYRSVAARILWHLYLSQ